jgi:hypothetical protein
MHTLNRPTVLLVVAAAFLLAAGGAPVRWLCAAGAAASFAAVWDGYAGVYRLLRAPRRANPGVQLSLCMLWLLATLAGFTLLNLAFEQALPGTFRLHSGAASPLDVAYLTLLTFASGGYGDIFPGTPVGKVLTMLTTLGGLIYATMFMTALWQHSGPE